MPPPVILNSSPVILNEVKNLLPLLLFLLALSCRQPASTELFVKAPGPYVFAVDMADSTAAYDFDLYTRIDATEFPAELRLDVVWKGPASDFKETVYLPVTRGHSFFSQESYAPYRTGVVPSNPGQWTLHVSLPNPPEGLRGMGLVVRRSPLAAQMVDNQ